MSKRAGVGPGKDAVDVEPGAVASGVDQDVVPDEDPVLGAGPVPDADRVLDRHGPGTRVRLSRQPLRPNALELARSQTRRLVDLVQTE